MAAETLTPQDALHINQGKNITLVQNWTVDPIHLHNTDKPLLTQTATLSVIDSCIGNITDKPIASSNRTLVLIEPHHIQFVFDPYLTDNGGIHRNTIPTTYDGEVYLKCRHRSNYLTGTYLSQIYDRGSSLRELIYILAKVAVLGTGTNWNDKVPSPTTWSNVDAANKTWAQIFDISSIPVIQINLLYGTTSPPTSRAKRMEILSAILTARYYRVEIIITDPSVQVNALVQNYTLKFCS